MPPTLLLHCTHSPENNKFTPLFCTLSLMATQQNNNTERVVKPKQAPFDLPEELVEHVFTFLPVKHAVKAGTVASPFAKTWTLSRHLVFDKTFPFLYNTTERAKRINQVFEAHVGPEVRTFTLHMVPMAAARQDFIKWLQICVQKGLQSLELKFYGQGDSLEAELLQIPTLTSLKLVNCGLPPVISGMRSLNTVVLRRIQLTDFMLLSLVLYCEQLNFLDIVRCTVIRTVKIEAKNHRQFKTLKIGGCPDVRRIEIDAPTLRHFYYHGVLPVIRMRSYIMFDEAYFHLQPSRPWEYVQSYDMEILVSDLSHVRVLTVSAQFLEALSARVRGSTFREAIFSLQNLKELQLFMDGGSFCNPFDIVTFLAHCPALETLIIDMNGYYFECGLYWLFHQKPHLDMVPNFSQLKFVKLLGFKFLDSELELVKVLLQKAPILESLIFITPKKPGSIPLPPPDPSKHNPFFQSWKASPAATIILYDHSDDRSGVVPTHPKNWH